MGRWRGMTCGIQNPPFHTVCRYDRLQCLVWNGHFLFCEIPWPSMAWFLLKKWTLFYKKTVCLQMHELFKTWVDKSQEVKAETALYQVLQMCFLCTAAWVLQGVQSFAFGFPPFGRFCCSSWRLVEYSALSFAGVPWLWSHAGFLTAGFSHLKPGFSGGAALKHILYMFIIHTHIYTHTHIYAQVCILL